MFDQEGSFAYFCTPHTGMDAVITVAASGGGGAAPVLSGTTAKVVAAAITAYDSPSSAGDEAYAQGPAAVAHNPEKVDDNGLHVCNAWLGSLEDAERKCNEDPACRYLYDYDSDGKAWQFCSSVTFAVNGAATVKRKPVRFWGGADGGSNPIIRDVVVADFTAGNGGQCSTEPAETIGSRVEVDGACWLHSHPDEGSVCDMSRWTFMHPGTGDAEGAARRNPIMKWAERGEAQIRFPAGHPLLRWRDAKKWPHNMQLVGKLGDVVDFAALPANLQTVAMAKAHGAVGDFPDVGFESCGSRGEVANEPAMAHRYTSTNVATADSALDQKSSQGQNTGTGKWLLWGTVVTHAQDQLRQRVAWGLSQILVVGEGFGDLFFPDWTESWAAYYDIFLAHAFGNYRDILREVSASPFMGQYLSMKGNVAFATLGKHPDENYAREIMQLFSIGLWQLNPDGTPKVDPSTNQYINTYSNADIVSFARVWTGWDLQPNRGNTVAFDDYHHRITNNLDQMLLKPERRDRFPKATILGKGHLGDGYPLCSGLGPRPYLKRGAKFEYVGPVSMLGELHDNPTKLPGIRPHFAPDAAKSALYSALCGRKDGKCTFPPTVTLASDLPCNGKVECGADILRAVKIVDGGTWGFYTFVEPPCVRLQFFGNGRAATNHGSSVCADPTLASNIGAQCCRAVDDKALCPDGVDDAGRVKVFQCEPHTGNAHMGDACRRHNAEAKCPVGCKKTSPGGKPHCALESDDTNSVPCHLDAGGSVSSGGGECLYVAEPMTFATAARRCAAEYTGGIVCDGDGKAALGESTVDGSPRTGRRRARASCSLGPTARARCRRRCFPTARSPLWTARTQSSFSGWTRPAPSRCSGVHRKA